MYPKVEPFPSSGLHQRLSTTRSTPQPVMCGAMGVCCMRYGVWDTSHLNFKATLRYIYTCTLYIVCISVSTCMHAFTWPECACMQCICTVGV